MFSHKLLQFIHPWKLYMQLSMEFRQSIFLFTKPGNSLLVFLSSEKFLINSSKNCILSTFKQCLKHTTLYGPCNFWACLGTVIDKMVLLKYSTTYFIKLYCTWSNRGWIFLLSRFWYGPSNPSIMIQQPSHAMSNEFYLRFQCLVILFLSLNISPSCPAISSTDLGKWGI